MIQRLIRRLVAGAHPRPSTPVAAASEPPGANLGETLRAWPLAKGRHYPEWLIEADGKGSPADARPRALTDVLIVELETCFWVVPAQEMRPSNGEILLTCGRKVTFRAVGKPVFFATGVVMLSAPKLNPVQIEGWSSG